MALYLPDPEGPDPTELIEAYGAELAARYTAAEQVLAEAIAKRAYVILALQNQTAPEARSLLGAQRRLQNLAMARMTALRELQAIARREVARILDENLAAKIIREAAQHGEAAAAARLRLARRLPKPAPVTATASSAVAQLTLDLTSRLETLNARILRYPQDAYQQIISETAPINLLGGETRLRVQQLAVQRFLADGIDGFTDRADRRWRIGTYAEMAGRTATQRAYQDAGVWRMQQSGVNLVTVVRGLDSCKKCAGWSGKILSTNGDASDVILPHAIEDRSIAVKVDGTVQDARNSGWGHPNCRCQLVAYLPGLTIPQNATTYDPDAEADREKQRAIERGIRASKRDAATAPNDIERRRALREVKEQQGEMREFLARTGRKRASYREQLHVADGTGRGSTPREPSAPRGPSGSPRAGIDVRIRKGTQLGDQVRAARSSIARVHTIPNALPPLQVVGADLGAGTLGRYMGSQSIIQMNRDGVTPRLTFAHETGHYLDHVLLGTSASNYETRMLTEQATRDWLAAVQNTDACRTLAAMAAADPTDEHLRYLLRPVELWGRSYAQWIATRSADADMLAELARMRASGNAWTSNRQWGKTDFEKVAAAIDVIFRTKGLLK